MDGCILVGTEKSLPHVVFLYILSDKVQLGAGGLEGWHQIRVLQHFPVIRERVRLDCSAGKEPAQSTMELIGKTFDGSSPPFVYFIDSAKIRLFELNWTLIFDNLSLYLHNFKEWTPLPCLSLSSSLTGGPSWPTSIRPHSRRWEVGAARVERKIMIWGGRNRFLLSTPVSRWEHLTGMNFLKNWIDETLNLQLILTAGGADHVCASDVLLWLNKKYLVAKLLPHKQLEYCSQQPVR